jgi:putative exported alpha-L-fucosidase protein|nr:alpha-L-fucosidase [uncultured Alistipes sp.]
MNRFLTICCALLIGACAYAQPGYRPAAENLASRQQFADARLGIFLHWGLYAMLGQGEWVMTTQNLNYREYEKLAGGFFPARFDADAWVSAFREAGARYICFTTRHHDGFSMFRTAQSPYNVVDATPFGRDVVKELADACHRQGLRVHFYYSLIDWWREDAPRGRTGLGTGRPDGKEDADAYFDFMKAQLTELLTQYGEVGAIWFDGVWDQDANPGFDWRLGELYGLIHKLQPGCLIVNNHHLAPFEGEDVQAFERDLPGENTAGYSGQEISRLPLETCQTMNGSWGYRITDRNYKSAETLIRYLAGAAGRGANLLLNIGPQADGELPTAALERLAQIGTWLEENGETIYGTQAGPVGPRSWGVTTRRGGKIYVHILDWPDDELFVPIQGERIRSAVQFTNKRKLPFSQDEAGVLLRLAERDSETDYIVELTLDAKINGPSSGPVSRSESAPGRTSARK